MSTTTAVERRSEPRARSLGTAVTQLDRWQTYEYRVEDLSAAGARLTGGPPLQPGRRVPLVLRLHGLPTIWVDARVIRDGGGGRGGAAVAFVDLEAAIEDLIHDVVVAALSGRRLHPLPMDGVVDFAAAEPLPPLAN